MNNIHHEITPHYTLELSSKTYLPTGKKLVPLSLQEQYLSGPIEQLTIASTYHSDIITLLHANR